MLLVSRHLLNWTWIYDRSQVKTYCLYLVIIVYPLHREVMGPNDVIYKWYTPRFSAHRTWILLQLLHRFIDCSLSELEYHFLRVLIWCLKDMGIVCPRSSDEQRSELGFTFPPWGFVPHPTSLCCNDTEDSRQCLPLESMTPKPCCIWLFTYTIAPLGKWSLNSPICIYFKN